jgi:hypothetical protein
MNDGGEDVSRPTDPEQVLAQPLPNQDLDLGEQKTGVSKVTLGLGIGVLVLAAFGGGVWTHSAFGSTTTSASTPAAGRPGGGGFRGGANGQTPPSGVPGNRAGGFGRGTIGTVDHVDGTTIYVKTQDGTVVKVSTSDTTKVELSKQGAVADLAAGNQVVVQGTAGDDGTVAAQTVTQRPATG